MCQLGQNIQHQVSGFKSTSVVMATVHRPTLEALGTLRRHGTDACGLPIPRSHLTGKGHPLLSTLTMSLKIRCLLGDRGMKLVSKEHVNKQERVQRVGLHRVTPKQSPQHLSGSPTPGWARWFRHHHLHEKRTSGLRDANSRAREPEMPSVESWFLKAPGFSMGDRHLTLQ